MTKLIHANFHLAQIVQCGNDRFRIVQLLIVLGKVRKRLFFCFDVFLPGIVIFIKNTDVPSLLYRNVFSVR